ncbi:MAG: hypothetical protein V7K50_11550 [Nostoc sp.]|uniref:hypothetical protein n=1 Tax=Nostoc sp. TaxID=1180 RepID=UPI002FFB7E9D
MRGQNNLLRSLAIALEHSRNFIPYHQRPGNVTRYCQIFIGHWALVLSVPLWGSKLRVASRREAVGAASRREVLGMGKKIFILRCECSLVDGKS